MKIEGPGLSRKVSLRAELVFSLAGLKRTKDISINTLSLSMIRTANSSIIIIFQLTVFF